MAERSARAKTDGDTTSKRRPTPLRASARRIDLHAKRTARIAQMGGPLEPWQAETWGFYDTSPEAGNAIMYSGHQMAKLRLFPGVLDPNDPDGLPIPADSDDSPIDAGLAEAAQRCLARLKSPLGGQSEILRAMTMNLEAAGECYVVGFAERVPSPEEIAAANLAGDGPPEIVPERWDVISISEIETKGEGKQAKTIVKLDGDDGKPRLVDPEKGDVVFRVWQRHPRWSNRADCAMRHCLRDLKILDALSGQVMASTNSQMHAGILMLSSNMTFSGSPITPALDDEHDQSPFEEALDDSYAIPMESPDDLWTVRPLVVFGTKEDIAAARFMSTARTNEDQIDARIKLYTDSLARGLALPVEAVMGHQATTFANAEQVDQDTFDDYLEPRCRLVVDAITIGFLRPELLDEGYAPEQIDRLVCWYDPGDLIGNPDTEGAADEGLKNGSISYAAWRRVKGYTEDDAPDAAETLVRLAVTKGVVTPQIMAALLDQLINEAGVTLPDDLGQAANHFPVAAAGAIDVASTLVSSSRRPLGVRLTEIDRRLYDRLQVAFSAAIERALERAGGRLRSKARGGVNADLIASTPNRDLARILGPALVADAASDDELLAGAWTTLAPYYRSQVGRAQQQARDLTAAQLPGVQRSTVEATQAEDLDAAWDWTEAELTASTKRAMFADIARATIGEADPDTRTPPGLVRQALARAGGQRGIEPRGERDGYLTLVAGEDHAAGGVATGQTILDAITGAGGQIDGFTWIYGDAPHPFEPHVDLDGIGFASYDDDALLNPDVFPPFPHYFPGDHEGCTCIAEPSVLGPDGEPL